MDLEAVKALLESQERTFRSAVDLVVDQLKERIRLVEGTMTEVIKSLEYSQAEARDLKNEVKVLRKSDNDKLVLIEGQQSRIAELELRVNYMDDYSRRNNLRITGLQEQSGSETWEQTSELVNSLLQDKLQLPVVSLERAHRVGPINASRTRPIVVRFEKYSDREAALRNAKKLKGTGIYINEDLCPASQEIKKKQLPVMKLAREEGKIAYFRHTRLIIKQRTGLQSLSMVHDDDSNLRRNNTVAGSGTTAAGEVGVRSSVGVATMVAVGSPVARADRTGSVSRDDGASSAQSPVSATVPVGFSSAMTASQSGSACRGEVVGGDAGALPEGAIRNDSGTPQNSVGRHQKYLRARSKK